VAQTLQQAAASCVIIGLLLAQTTVAFDLTDQVFGVRHRKGYYWPILDYPMYKGAHYPGEEFTRYVIVGLWPDGREAEMTPEDFGLNFWKFEKGPVRALRAEDRKALAPFLAHYERRRGLRPTALRLENHPWVLGPQGLERVAPRALAELHLEPGQGGS